MRASNAIFNETEMGQSASRDAPGSKRGGGGRGEAIADDLSCLRSDAIEGKVVAGLEAIYAKKGFCSTSAAAAFIRDVRALDLMDPAELDKAQEWVADCKRDLPFFEVFRRVVPRERLSASAEGVLWQRQTLLGVQMSWRELEAFEERPVLAFPSYAPQPDAPLVCCSRDVVVYMCSFLSLGSVFQLSRSCKRMFEVCNTLLSRIKPPTVVRVRLEKAPLATNDDASKRRFWHFVDSEDTSMVWQFARNDGKCSVSQVHPTVSEPVVVPFPGDLGNGWTWDSVVMVGQFVIFVTSAWRWMFVDVRTGESGWVESYIIPQNFQLGVFGDTVLCGHGKSLMEARLVKEGYTAKLCGGYGFKMIELTADADKYYPGSSWGSGRWFAFLTRKHSPSHALCTTWRCDRLRDVDVSDSFRCFIQARCFYLCQTQTFSFICSNCRRPQWC
jgi:hypothetical protein